MKKLGHMLVYLPALLLWVPFAIAYRAAGAAINEERYMVWTWLGIQAVDMEVYEIQDDKEW